MRKLNNLVVIPSEPLIAYEKAGYGKGLEDYFNPNGAFDNVYVLSTREKQDRQIGHLKIVQATPLNFRNRLKALQPTIIRAYGGFWSCDLAVANQIQGVPVVVSVHDTNPALLHKSIVLADVVICMSEAIRDLVLSKGVHKDVAVVLPNRVDREIFRPNFEDLYDSNQPRDLNSKVILHVGRNSPEKNIETIIRSLELLPNNIKCVFIGAGNRLRYESLAKKLNVDTRCTWIESVQNSELQFWYTHCDVFCFPSRYEGFGIVLIEAAASGSVIVSSNISPINQILSHRQNALLVDAFDNPIELAAALQEAIFDTDLRNKLKAGALLASEAYDKFKVDLQEADIYKSIVRAQACSSKTQYSNLFLLCKVLFTELTYKTRLYHYKHWIRTKLARY